MNTDSHDQSNDPAGGEDVGRLIRLAGARSEPTGAIEDLVRDAVHREWRATIAARRARRRRRHWFAASLVIGVIGSTWVGLRSVDKSPVATLVAARGAVLITPATDRPIVAVGDALPAGTHIQTDAGAMVVVQAGSVQVRIGPATRIDLQRSGKIRLIQGELYVDSGPQSSHDPLQIVTSFGSVTHLGTQYQVQVLPNEFMLTSVREGQVSIEVPGNTQAPKRTLKSGHGLRVSEGGDISPIVVLPYDTSWNWVNGLVPDFPIEGRSLATFLDWYVRETGRALVFVAPANRDAAVGSTLSGNIAGLTPEQALDAVMATTRFQCDASVPGQVRIGLDNSAAGTMQHNATSRAPPQRPKT